MELIGKEVEIFGIKTKILSVEYKIGISKIGWAILETTDGIRVLNQGEFTKLLIFGKV